MIILIIALIASIVIIYLYSISTIDEPIHQIFLTCFLVIFFICFIVIINSKEIKSKTKIIPKIEVSTTINDSIIKSDTIYIYNEKLVSGIRN